MKRPLLRRQRDIVPVIARDGAIIHELFTHSSMGMENVGLAIGVLTPGRTALPHYHELSEETYFVVSGSGKVVVGEETFEIGPGDTVFVPVKVVHSLENTSPSESLKVLCVSSPPFCESDFYTCNPDGNGR